MTDSIEIQTQTCPKCGEESPEAAVMCWACYSPLGNAKLAPIRPSEDEPELRFPRPAWWRGKAEIAAQIAMIGALVSSGWWRGKARFSVLSAGLAGVGIFVGLEKRADSQRAKQREQNKIDPRDRHSAVCHIADTILIQAITFKTAQVRIRPLEFAEVVDYPVEVVFLIEGEWSQWMNLPLHLWRPLQNEFQMRAESDALRISSTGLRIENPWWRRLTPADQNAAFALRILIEPPHAEILLTRI